jgi:hypothetical protein
MRRRHLTALIPALLVLFTAVASPQAKPAAAPAKVDINTASEQDLVSLPGVGPATAKKIVAGRPYASVSDLSKAGLNAGTIAKITAAGAVASAAKGAAPAATAATSAAKTAASSATTAAKTAPATAAAAAGSCAAGQVWANSDSKVYHRAGDRWFGKTKKGQCMNEADAQKAGYSAAKEGAVKKKK